MFRKTMIKMFRPEDLYILFALLGCTACKKNILKTNLNWHEHLRKIRSGTHIHLEILNICSLFIFS